MEDIYYLILSCIENLMEFLLLKIEKGLLEGGFDGEVGFTGCVDHQ